MTMSTLDARPSIALITSRRLGSSGAGLLLVGCLLISMRGAFPATLRDLQPRRSEDGWGGARRKIEAHRTRSGRPVGSFEAG